MLPSNSEENKSVLSNVQILEEIERGNLVIFEFNNQQLNNTSYDVKLGAWYYSPQEYDGMFDPERQSDIDKYWGTPKKAEDYIVIPPNTTFLCHTEEFIGGVKDITTMMKAKSTIGRCCISVCQCAGWGDVGYFNRWTLEVRNQSNVFKKLRVGLPIAQVVFLYTWNAVDYVKKGRYQNSSDLDKLIDQWTPEQMKPKAL